MKKYQCIVIWTFNDDFNEENRKKLLKVLDNFNFEEIDQSTWGSQKVNIQDLINKLKGESFNRCKNDFIKVAYTAISEGIIVQEVKKGFQPVNEGHARMLEIMNYMV